MYHYLEALGSREGVDGAILDAGFPYALVGGEEVVGPGVTGDVDWLVWVD